MSWVLDSLINVDVLSGGFINTSAVTYDLRLPDPIKSDLFSSKHRYLPRSHFCLLIKQACEMESLVLHSRLITMVQRTGKQSSVSSWGFCQIYKFELARFYWSKTSLSHITITVYIPISFIRIALEYKTYSVIKPWNNTRFWIQEVNLVYICIVTKTVMSQSPIWKHQLANGPIISPLFILTLTRMFPGISQLARIVAAFLTGKFWVP